MSLSTKFTRPLRLEALEGRWVPAVSFSRGAVAINSTNAADRILIEDNFNAAGGVRITENGVVTTIPTGVQRIDFRTFGGSDTVEYFLMNSLTAAQSRRVGGNLGDGPRDQFLARLFNRRTGFGSDLLPGAKLTFHVHGGKGNDTLELLANRDTDVMAGFDRNGRLQTAALTVDFGGNEGNDTVNVQYRGELDGHFFLFAGGQEHRDFITAQLTFDVGSTGKLAGTAAPGVGGLGTPARVRGKEGNDVLRFEVRDFGRANVYARIEGVDGYDIGHRTANVLSSELEENYVVV